ncbi:MAG: Protease Do precursor [Rhodobacteraceae bacterium]|nr:MAG: Protease Do precursor [Paracoccaceae bacterium]
MPTSSKIRRWPTLVLAALLGATSLTAIGPFALQAQAAVAQAGGYADLVERVAPAVVYIAVTKTPEASGLNPAGLPEGAPADEFARRFGMPFAGDPGSPEGQTPDQQAVGTGFIISAGGDIVTNNHVVEGADTVKVTLADGTELAAEVVGTDPATDLALVRVKADKSLPFVEWGESARLRTGQDVVAIGNPFGLGNSVTSGIVSALGRDINSGPLDNFIQTDAAINRGNSGGPLFDAEGRVVGINTAIVSPTGGSVGIGFAVPSDTARSVIADLAVDGKVDRGWLGVSIQPLTEDIAAAIGLDRPNGALVAEVAANTPAAKAGLKRGDVVTAVDSNAVNVPRDLTRLVASAPPGTQVRLSILRAGQPSEVTVVLGNRSAQPA